MSWSNRNCLLSAIVAAAFILTFSACKTATRPTSVAARGSAPFAAETFDTVWTKIHEHHFDTNFNGHDWLAVREKYRPRALQARSTQQLRDTIQEMIDLLDVSHMAIVPGELSDLLEAKDDGGEASVERADEEDSGVLGLEVRFIGDDLVVTRVYAGSQAAAAGIAPGWIVRRIGTLETRQLLQASAGKLDQQRREFLAWRAAARKLSGAPGTELELELIDGRNQARVVTLKRELAPGEATQFGSLPVMYAHLESREIRTARNLRVGVVRFDIWLLPTALAFNKAIDPLRDCDGIIIDLRGNVGGMVGMIIGTAGHFVEKPIILGALVARDNTFQLPANPRFVDSSGQAVTPYGGPLAILVDQITASASEVFTGGLQEAGRARVFGRRTSGQALPALLDELPNGDAFYHPISDFVTPKGIRFEGRGVIPDEEVPLVRSVLLGGRDADVERAVAWIEAKSAGR